MEEIFLELKESINEELDNEVWKREIKNEILYLIKNCISNNYTKSDVSKIIKKVSEVSNKDGSYDIRN